MHNVLFWFRNDLRLHDNEALVKAMEMGKVLPAFIIDPVEFKKTKYGFKRKGAFRVAFMLETLADLKRNLQNRGSDLIIKIGRTEDELLKLITQYNISTLVTSKEVTQEETTMEYEISTRLKPLNVEMEIFWGATLYHVRDLPFQLKFLPDVFTEFRTKIEQITIVRSLFDTPEIIDTVENIEFSKVPTLSEIGFQESLGDLTFPGGESHALARLNYYIWESNSIEHYKETRNELIGNNFSSRLSSYLSLGAISPRKIYWEIKKYEAEIIANDSTYWLIFELLWRDYFHFISLKYGIRIFKRSGIRHLMNKKWRKNRSDFERWMKGETGVPFIDANMRELNATGYMSNRGRQVVASFFAKDLNLEWWWGAMYFESQLIDYDVCSNWCNWNYIAGIGNDPRKDRYFNILKQAYDYDPDAIYTKFWLPELNKLSSTEVHEIGLQSEESLADKDVVLGNNYPVSLFPFDKWKK